MFSPLTDSIRVCELIGCRVRQMHVLSKVPMWCVPRAMVTPRGRNFVASPLCGVRQHLGCAWANRWDKKSVVSACVDESGENVERC